MMHTMLYGWSAVTHEVTRTDAALAGGCGCGVSPEVSPGRPMKCIKLFLPRLELHSTAAVMPCSTPGPGPQSGFSGGGFAGGIKRWGFARGNMTHGSKSKREHGSIGMNSTPSRVFPGLKMPGQMGNVRTKLRKLEAGSRWIGLAQRAGFVIAAAR